MKRVIAACIHQTLRFQVKEDIPHEEAVRLVKAEVEHYTPCLTLTFFSELRRCYTHDAFEALNKVVGCVESQPVGYFRDGKVRGFQEQPGTGDLGLADIA